MDSQGNAVVTILNAIGVNADWIDTGDLIVGGKNHNTDGSIRIYDKDGKIIGILNKDGIDLNGSFHSSGVWTEDGNTVNCDISIKNGILTMKANDADNSACVIGIRYSLPRIYIGNNMFYSEITEGEITTPTVTAKQISTEELTSNEIINAGLIKASDVQLKSIKSENGLSAFEIDEANELVNFSFDAIINKLTASSCEIDSVKIQSMQTTQYEYKTSSFDFTFIQSGVFVIFYGSATVYSLKQNEYMEFAPFTQPSPLPATLIPKHFRIKTASNGPGGRIFTITLSSAGYLQIRNCGKDYVTDTPGELGFRFDYYLM